MSEQTIIQSVADKAGLTLHRLTHVCEEYANNLEECVDDYAADATSDVDWKEFWQAYSVVIGNTKALKRTRSPFTEVPEPDECAGCW